jgi:hypothetical protein
MVVCSLGQNREGGALARGCKRINARGHSDLKPLKQIECAP